MPYFGSHSVSSYYGDGGVWVEEGDTVIRLEVMRPIGPRPVIIQAEGRCRVDDGDIVRSPTGCWYKSSNGQQWMEPVRSDK